MLEHEAIEKIKEKACNNRCIPELCNDGCMYGNEKCAFSMAIKALENEAVSKKLLEAAAEEIENLYGRDTNLSIEIRNFLKV